MKILYVPFLRAHIDLESITAIGDVQFEDHMGSGGYMMRVVIHLKLHDKPLIQDYWLRNETEIIRGATSLGLRNTEGELITPRPENYKTLQVLVDYQKRVSEELLEPWKALRSSYGLISPTEVIR